MNSFDLDFYELSEIADDPKKLEQLKNRYFDPEFDEWLEEFDKEQEELSKSDDSNNNELEMPDEETVDYNSNMNYEEYEDGTESAANEEWEMEE